MAAAVELELGLHRKDSKTWSVELRCALPNEDSEVRVERSGAALDLELLRHQVLDDEAYGRVLGESLFAIPEVRQQFSTARAAAESHDLPLRVRLFIGTSAPELHDVRWETMRDPGTGFSLVTSERVLFSRYLSSADWRPVAVRSQARLRALVVVANGDDLPSYQPGGKPVAAVDVQGELERALDAMPGVHVEELGSSRRATLGNLAARLRDGYDVLYLVCHGFLYDGQPQLLLEDEAGAVARVPGVALVESVSALRTPPRLVVLASCQSAGTGWSKATADNGALAALGPRLAEAGVAAVLAMQGNISMETVARFMPVFFKELQRDGQIDRAMAVARAAVRERPDWWAPVLLMRLKSGRIWYRSGFADAKFEKWPSLLEDIAEGRCTPILGPGLTDNLIGSRRELAWRWAREYHFPMAPYEQDDLPRVAQYLSVNQNRRFPRDRLRKHVREELLDWLSDESRHDRDGHMDDLIAAVVEKLDDNDPHKVLAGLPLPMYLTTQPLDLMAAAVRSLGKKPRVEVCRWNDGIRWPPPNSIGEASEIEPSYRPDDSQPFVFHLFGHLEERRSLVLTEDDYFDYLIGVTSSADNAIPHFVQSALVDSSLLFLGFRMEEWDFRVLFRSIMNQEGGGRRGEYSHVQVQIDPEQSHTLEPERARSYLERYFQEAEISIYWGSVEDFARELGQWWAKQVR